MRYNIAGYLTITVVKTIEANSLEEAIGKADELSPPSLCHQCDSAGKSSEDSWELAGFDDPPDDCVKYVNGEEVERKGGAR
jgi:hypothetical protein